MLYLNLGKYDECLEKSLPSHHEAIRGEVLVFKGASVGATEGCLHGKDVWNVQLFKHRHPRRPILASTHGEARLLK